MSITGLPHKCPCEELKATKENLQHIMDYTKLWQKIQIERYDKIDKELEYVKQRILKMVKEI